MSSLNEKNAWSILESKLNHKFEHFRENEIKFEDKQKDEILNKYQYMIGKSKKELNDIFKNF